MDRLKLYQDALVLLKETTQEHKSSTGLCHVLSDAYCRIEYGKTFSELWNDMNELRDQDAWEMINDGVFGRGNIFPEIAAHKSNDRDSGYWPITYEDRIKILEESIEQAKADYAAKEDYDMNHYDGDSSYNE